MRKDKNSIADDSTAALAATSAPLSFLETKQKRRLACRRLAGGAPGVLFAHGLMSDMNGAKALAVEAWCARRRQACVRFDFSGHGQSSGAPQDGRISDWRDDCIAVLDSLTSGGQILIGSSLGAWIALLAALARKSRIKGLLAVAAAIDATETLMRRKLNRQQRQQLAAKGAVQVRLGASATPYEVSSALLEDARRYLLLASPLPLACPVRLIHGMDDRDVPWRLSLQLAERLQSSDVALTLIKDGAHRLSRDSDIAVILRQLDELITHDAHDSHESHDSPGAPPARAQPAASALRPRR